MKKILVINISRMGDLLQSSTMISGLKEQWQDVEISLLGSKRFIDVANSIPGIDRLIDISLDEVIKPLIQSRVSIYKSYNILKMLIAELRLYNFDHVINITHTYFSAIISALIKCDSFVGMSMDQDGYKVVKGDWSNYYFNSCLNRAFNRFNLVDINNKVGGLIPREPKIRLHISAESRTEAAELIARFNRPASKLIGIVPGASSSEKTWHTAYFAETIRELAETENITPIIFGAESEKELGIQIEREIPGVINLCGQTDFLLLSALIEKCSLLLTNDTGPMHIAAALGTKIVDISLGSALSHETAPYGEGHIVIEPRIDCYPCHVKMKCSHRSCHSRIQSSVVSEMAKLLLQDRNVSSIQDRGIYASVNILKTGFDESRMWELRPIIRRELTVHDIYNDALRELWKRTLSGSNAWDESYRSDLRKIAAKLSREHLPIRENLLDAIDMNPLNEMVELADSGAVRAQELAVLSNNAKAIDRLIELGNLLREVDQGLIRLSYEHPAIQPLVAQFVYSKDNLEGWQLDILARQTVELYRNLVTWGTALTNWVRGIAVELQPDPELATNKLTLSNTTLLSAVKRLV